MTPGQRGLVSDRTVSELWKRAVPEKTLTQGLTKKGGRNNTGRITARRIGGGAKRLYRIVDFKRRKFDVPATVERIEYDPNRTRLPSHSSSMRTASGPISWRRSASAWATRWLRAARPM